MISFFKKTISGLSKTRNKLTNLFSGFSGKSILDESDLEELEKALLNADIGWELTEIILETLWYVLVCLHDMYFGSVHGEIVILNIC